MTFRAPPERSDPSPFEFPDVLRGRYVTARDYPIRNGQTVEQWQVLALDQGSLIPWDSESGLEPYCISMRAVHADVDTWSDYIISAQEFNGPKLVFANEVDSYQSVIEALRRRRIYLGVFNENQRLPALGESS